MPDAPQVEIRTLPDALAQLDAWIVAYDRLAEAHAEALRVLAIEHILCNAGWEAWERDWKNWKPLRAEDIPARGKFDDL